MDHITVWFCLNTDTAIVTENAKGIWRKSVLMMRQHCRSGADGALRQTGVNMGDYHLVISGEKLAAVKAKFWNNKDKSSRTPA